MKDGILEKNLDFSAFGHGFQRVHEQIDQHLLEGTPCSRERGEAFWGFDTECRVVFSEAFLKKGVDVMKKFLQVNGLEIKGSRFEFFQMRSQEFIDAPGFVGDEPDLSLNFRGECVRVRNVRGQTSDADQGIADFMEDSSGKLSDELDLFGMPQGFEHLFPVGQIRQNRQEKVDRPVRIHDGTDSLPHQKFALVFSFINKTIDEGFTRTDFLPEDVVEIGALPAGRQKEWVWGSQSAGISWTATKEVSRSKASQVKEQK